jgi:hypothetical protein
MKNNIPNRKVKEFIDPIFSIPQKCFPVCRIYLDGKWKGEPWINTETKEYGLKFRNFEGTAVDIVFPSNKARQDAAELIIPDNPLEKPHSDYLIKRISNNSSKINKQHIKKLIIAAAGILTVWSLFRKHK